MAVALSPDGRLLAGARVGVGKVCIYGAKTPVQVNEPILTLVTGQQSMYGVTFSPDSKFLATAGANYTGIKIWKMPAADPNS